MHTYILPDDVTVGTYVGKIFNRHITISIWLVRQSRYLEANLTYYLHTYEG